MPQSWLYEVNDVLLIARKGEEVLARVADYVDSLDDTTPLYVNLRIGVDVRVPFSGRWTERRTKIQPEQIIKPLPDWYDEQKAQFEASIKETADKVWARMSPAEKEQVHQFNIAHGLGFQRKDTRSPLERMIDKACGVDKGKES